MKPNLQLLENRHEIPAEELSEFISTNFGTNLLTLRQLEPYITEIKRRFKTLPRTLGVDGNYKTISGHRSLKVGVMVFSVARIDAYGTCSQSPRRKNRNQGTKRKQFPLC